MNITIYANTIYCAKCGRPIVAAESIGDICGPCWGRIGDALTTPEPSDALLAATAAGLDKIYQTGEKQ